MVNSLDRFAEVLLLGEEDARYQGLRGSGRRPGTSSNGLEGVAVERLECLIKSGGLFRPRGDGLARCCIPSASRAAHYGPVRRTNLKKDLLSRWEAGTPGAIRNVPASRRGKTGPGQTKGPRPFGRGPVVRSYRYRMPSLIRGLSDLMFCGVAVPTPVLMCRPGMR